MLQRSLSFDSSSPRILIEVIDDAANMVDGRPIPDLYRLHKLGLPRWPPGDSMHFLDDPGNEVQLASVCLNDCYHMFSKAHYALLEGFRRLEHYRRKEPPNEPSAVFFGQFYGADVALRLYAAGEHLANSIVKILGIDNGALSRYRKNRVSLQATVAEFLRDNVPNHPLSVAVKRLGGSEEWRGAVEYRNDWVHEQAPLVSGTGLVFKRGKQIWRQQTQDGSTAWTLAFGGGDAPELSVNDLLEKVRAAGCLFESMFVAVATGYQELLSTATAPKRDRQDTRNSCLGRAWRMHRPFCDVRKRLTIRKRGSYAGQATGDPWYCARNRVGK